MSILEYRKGFTLVEMLVAVALFLVVMVVALGALLSMSQANRKAQSIKAVVNNLNSSLESMTRNIRTGRSYDLPNDPSRDYFTFIQSDGRYAAYCLDSTSKTIRRLIDTSPITALCSDFLPLTATEVKIEKLDFYLTGATAGDSYQPKLTVLIKGYVQVSAGQQSKFNLQTSVTQRLYDL